MMPIIEGDDLVRETEQENEARFGVLVDADMGWMLKRKLQGTIVISHELGDILCAYLLNHHDDIVEEMEDFGFLKPLLNDMERLSDNRRSRYDRVE